MQRSEERLSNARAQRNRLLAAFEGIHAAEDDMEAVIARCSSRPTCLTKSPSDGMEQRNHYIDLHVFTQSEKECSRHTIHAIALTVTLTPQSSCDLGTDQNAVEKCRQ